MIGLLTVLGLLARELEGVAPFFGLFGAGGVFEGAEGVDLVPLDDDDLELFEPEDLLDLESLL